MTASWFTPEHAPPHARDGVFVITRYADTAVLLRHPSIVSWEPWLDIIRVGSRAGRDYTALTTLLQGMLPSQNAESHGRYRSLGRQALVRLAPAFAHERVAAVIHENLVAAQAAGRVEAMRSLCRAIPSAVMAGALGLSPACMSAIRRAAQSVFAVYEPGLSLRVLDAIDVDARAAQAEILGEIERARTDSSMGLSQLLTFIDARFDERAFAGFLFFLVLAGIETVTGLLGSMTWLLLTFPDEWQRLVANPSLGARCVEEAIRFAGPMRRVAPRLARQPVALGGVTLPKGAIILAELEQAHHDPAAFAEPERFDVSREGPPHMGFALGAHGCLGASFGRLEALLFLRALLQSPRVALLEENPVWENHKTFRRLERLELVFS